MSLQRLEWAERQRNASHVFASFSLANIPLGSSSFAHNREFLELLAFALPTSS